MTLSSFFDTRHTIPDVSILCGSVVNSSYIHVPRRTLVVGPLAMEVRGRHVHLWRRNSLSLMLLIPYSTEASEDCVVRLYDGAPFQRYRMACPDHEKRWESHRHYQTLAKQCSLTRTSLGNWRPMAYSKRRTLVPTRSGSHAWQGRVQTVIGTCY